MATVKNPRIKPDGMVKCEDCPLDEYECYDMVFLMSDGNFCPTLDTYQEADKLAEKEAQR